MAGKEDACPKSEMAEAVVEMAVGVSSEVDHPLAEEEAAVSADLDSDSEINWVEMPLSNVRWVLGRRRESDPVLKLEDYGIYTQEDLNRKDADMLIRRMIASLQADQDDFFEYQAWVRDVFLRNGRVMVPEDVIGPKDELQKAINEAWGDGIVIDDGSDGDVDHEARDNDSSTKEVLPSKI